MIQADTTGIISAVPVKSLPNSLTHSAKEKSELPGESSLFSEGGKGTGQGKALSVGVQATLRSLPKVAGAMAGRLTFEPGPPRGG